MGRRIKRRYFVLTSIVILICVVFFGPLDYGLRYIHFMALTKDKLLSGTDAYIRNHTDGNQAACLYVVRCEDGNARLDLVEDLDTWDFPESKRTIWRRRFSDVCQGRTTNIGLQLIPQAGGEPLSESTAFARWSFFNDRFVPRQSRIQGGAFSDQAWAPCTAEYTLSLK